MAGNLIDLDELDIDTLCNSLNNIADKKTNNQKLKYLDQLYEKTIALASPRITKNKSILSQLIPSTPISTPTPILCSLTLNGPSAVLPHTLKSIMRG